MPSLWVVGSLNVDLAATVERPALKGETLAGGDLRVFPGGKGANQAVAAARLGADVRMVGRIGRDVFADVLLDSLNSAKVDAGAVERTERATGVALIHVFPDGDNTIVLSPGANLAITPDEVRRSLAGLASDDYLLCQLETPLDAVHAALDTAKERGATTILDPAPARTLPSELLARVDILTPNETEAATLLGGAAAEGGDEAALDRAARDLQRKGPRSVILKLGARGCFCHTEERSFLVPGFAVSAVDSTGAGDTFNAALGVALSQGKGLAAACRFANAAAAVSVTKAGAQTSAPSLAEVQRLLEEPT